MRASYCYWCGSTKTGSRDHIPGRLFDVKGNIKGVVVPACRGCNKNWESDQQFFRLRLVMHVGSGPGSALVYCRDRELKRLSSEKNYPGVRRYLAEHAKTVTVDNKHHTALTDGDREKVRNVIRHWAAALHYARTECLAAVPGTYIDTLGPPRISLPKLQDKLVMPATGSWSTNCGRLIDYWFLPGRSVHSSSVVFNILGLDSLWFLVKF
jgi:hypothetical protein